MKIHSSFLPTSAVGCVYTSGMTESGLAELLVQDVPRNKARLICCVLQRQMDRLRTKRTHLYTDKRIIHSQDKNYFFRVIQVKHEEHKINLLTHTMHEWNAIHVNEDDSVLRHCVDLFIITPWFFEDAEEWGGLPAAPGGHTKPRNKILWTALSRHARGLSRWSSEPLYAQDADDADDRCLDDDDVIYFLKNGSHFCQCLEVSNCRVFLDHMPPRFAMEALAFQQARWNSQNMAHQRVTRPQPRQLSNGTLDNPVVLDNPKCLQASPLRTPLRSRPLVPCGGGVVERPRFGGTHSGFRFSVMSSRDETELPSRPECSSFRMSSSVTGYDYHR